MTLSARLRSAALFIGVLYFTFIGGSFYTDFILPLRLFHEAAVTVLLGGWLISLLWQKEPFPNTGLDVALLVWLAVCGLTASLGLSPRYSWERLWSVLALALGFYLLVYLKRRGWVGQFVRSLYLAAAAVCVVALMEWFSWYFGIPLVPSFTQGWPQATGWTNLFPPYIYRVGLPMNGPTPLSAYVAVLIPPAVVLRFVCRRKDDRQALSVWLALAAVVEILSFSRGGLLALMVSLPLLGLGWLAVYMNAEKVRAIWGRPAGRRAVAAGCLVALLGLGAGGWWFSHTFSNRQGSTDFRFTLWKVAGTLFAEHPLTGVGPYNFGRGLLLRNDPDLPRQQITTPHDLYLDTAAESGLLGLLAGGGLLICAGWTWYRRWQGAQAAPEQRMLLVGAGAALAGFAAENLVDTYQAWPVLVPALALAAYCLTDDGHVVSRPETRPVKAAGALGALVVYGMVLIWMGRGDAHFEASVSAAQQGRLTDAIQEAQQAVAEDPTWPLYVFQLASVEGQSSQPEVLAAAAQHYRQGLALEPVDGTQTANLAGVLWRQGAHADAIAALERANRLEPNPVYLVNLGYFYEADNRLPEAGAVYAQILLEWPDLAGSEFWQAEARRAQLWPDVMRLAEQQMASASPYSQANWRLAVALARADWPTIEAQARAMLAVAPADYTASVTLAQVAVRAGDYAEARRLVAVAHSADPLAGRAYWVQGLIDEAQGNLVRAEREWREAVFLGEPLANGSLVKLALAHGDAAAAQKAQAALGNATTTYAVSQDIQVALYNRRATFDVLPPLFRIGANPTSAMP